MTLTQDPQKRPVLAVALYRSDKPAEAKQGLRLVRRCGGSFYDAAIVPELKATLALAAFSANRNARAHALMGLVCTLLPDWFRHQALTDTETIMLCGPI